MAVNSQLDFNALSAAIRQGIVEGNKSAVEVITADAGKRHDLRGIVQGNTDKVWELDGEVKLIKGFMVTLMGTGDGNGGMVNRIDKDMSTLSDDVATLKSQMSEMNRKLDTILPSISAQKSFMDGWKGVGIAVGIMSACIGVLGGIGGALLWLFQHGGVK